MRKMKNAYMLKTKTSKLSDKAKYNRDQENKVTENIRQGIKSIKLTYSN